MELKATRNKETEDLASAMRKCGLAGLYEQLSRTNSEEWEPYGVITQEQAQEMLRGQDTKEKSHVVEKKVSIGEREGRGSDVRGQALAGMEARVGDTEN